MIDCHIILSKSTPEHLRDRAVESATLAVAMAGFSVELHLVAGGKGLGIHRAKGYRLGTAPYVTYIDDDDFVERDHFSQLRPLIDSGVPTIGVRQKLIWNREVPALPPSSVPDDHYTPVFKREFLIDHSHYLVAGDVHQRKTLEAYFPITFAPSDSYVWVVRDQSNAYRLMDSDRSLFGREMLIPPIILSRL